MWCSIIQNCNDYNMYLATEVLYYMYVLSQWMIQLKLQMFKSFHFQHFHTNFQHAKTPSQMEVYADYVVNSE